MKPKPASEHRGQGRRRLTTRPVSSESVTLHAGLKNYDCVNAITGDVVSCDRFHQLTLDRPGLGAALISCGLAMRPSTVGGCALKTMLTGGTETATAAGAGGQ